MFWSRDVLERWIPIDPDSITGEETEIEEPGVVRHEAWHRRHQCVSRFKRKSPPVAFGSFSFERMEAYSQLHLLPTAPIEVIRAAHRALAALHHPDRGGSGEKMVAINAAYETLKRG